MSKKPNVINLSAFTELKFKPKEPGTHFVLDSSTNVGNLIQALSGLDVVNDTLFFHRYSRSSGEVLAVKSAHLSFLKRHHVSPDDDDLQEVLSLLRNFGIRIPFGVSQQYANSLGIFRRQDLAILVEAYGGESVYVEVNTEDLWDTAYIGLVDLPIRNNVSYFESFESFQDYIDAHPGAVQRITDVVVGAKFSESEYRWFRRMYPRPCLVNVHMYANGIMWDHPCNDEPDDRPIINPETRLARLRERDERSDYRRSSYRRRTPTVRPGRELDIVTPEDDKSDK